MVVHAHLPPPSQVCDFGFSIRLRDNQSHISNTRHGAPFYIAPEVGSSSEEFQISFPWYLQGCRILAAVYMTLGVDVAHLNT